MDSEDRSTQKDTSSSAVASSLSDLIARLEKATGPDRELDAHIAASVGLPMTFCDFDAGCYHGDCISPGCGKPLGLTDERRSYPSDWRDDDRLPHYTSSIDAAMTLKPGYHKYILGSEWCAVWQEDGRYNDAERVPTRNRPAIALCIAALKAQLSTRDDAERDSPQNEGSKMNQKIATELGHAAVDNIAFMAIATRTDAVVADIALDALTDAGLRVVSGTAIESTAELLAAYEAQIFILEKKCNDLRGVTK